MTGYPATASEIDPTWLTDRLQEADTLAPGVAVTDVAVEPLPAGVGFMGEVARARLTYSGEGKHPPATMITKIPTADPTIREMMRPTRVFEREARFYGELADATPLRSPACYLSAFDPATDDQLLLLEDLSGYTEGDQLAGCSAEQAARALRVLAQHHAAFWGGEGIQGADYVPDVNGPLNLAGKEIYAASLPGFDELFGHLVHPELRPAVDAFSANVPQLLDRIFAMPHTLMHFDYRADNLFFDGDDDVVVIDWQTIARGGGAYDVGYFLSQNLSVDTRRAHEDDLLRGYLDTLAANGVTDYSEADLRQDYRVGIMYGWVIPVFATGTLDPSSDRAMALWTDVIERCQVAMEDHDAAALVEV